MAAGFVARPYVSDFTDDEVVAAAIAENTGRWAFAAMLMVAAAVVLIFVESITDQLRGYDCAIA